MKRVPGILWMVLLLGSVAPLNATPVEIVSPDTAQTFSYGHAAKKKLWWLEKEGVFCAEITFDNFYYANSTDPPKHETFLFKFPEVTFDPATKVFSVRGDGGRRVPVAVREKGLFGIGSWIRPLPGTIIYISKHHGEVKLILTATDRKQVGLLEGHWVEDNEGWCLQNLLRDLSSSR
ncbi:MAG: hypothetical protein HZA88_08255 [Verrucomicrobia bacterium]|nr:hypothetical protein [Verrucomicrobiota bacterium]